jgi:hypothetical protein
MRRRPSRATVQSVSKPEFASNSGAISVPEIAKILRKNFADPNGILNPH